MHRVVEAKHELTDTGKESARKPHQMGDEAENEDENIDIYSGEEVMIQDKALQCRTCVQRKVSAYRYNLL